MSATDPNSYQKLFFEAAEDGMLLADAQERIADANPAACRLLGKERERLVGAALGTVFDPSYPFLGVAREARGGGTFEGAVRLVRGDGSPFPAEVSLVGGEDGAPLGVVFRRLTTRRRAEEELRQSEERFGATFEQAAVGLALVGTDGRWLRVNRKLCQIVGYGREELLGVTFQDITHPDDLDGDLEHLGRLAAGEIDTYCTEKRCVRKDGSTTWINLTVSPGRGPSGKPDYLISVVEDITERKRAEEALKESEERLRSLIRNASDVVTVLEADGTVRYESPAVERVLGYGPEELVGKNALDYVHPEDREHLSGAFGEKIRNSRGVQMDVEFRFLHADGSWRHLEAVVNNLLEDPGVAGIVANSRDVTERKRAEKSLRHSFGMLLALHEGNRVLTSTLESEEIASQLLELMRGVSGLTAAVISVKDEPDEEGWLRVWRSAGLDALWPRARYSPEAEEARRAVLDTGEHRLFALRRPAPETGHLVGLCLPLRVGEHTRGLLEAYGPEALEKEDAIELLRSLANQAASALDKARLYGELAEREKRLENLIGKVFLAQEEERRRVAYEVHDGLAQVAVAAHQHLQAFARFHPPDSEESRQILDRALDLVQRTVGDARRIIANLRPTALDDFGLRTAVRLEVEALRAEGWRIDFGGNLRDDERLPFAVETALFRVVQEALTNIRKHAHTKQVRLSFDRLKQGVRLGVQDRGRGFDPSALTDGGGPGERIGLSSMRERVALLGGDFRIRSNPGSGTSITVEVPLRKRSEADPETDDAG